MMALCMAPTTIPCSFDSVTRCPQADTRGPGARSEPIDSRRVAHSTMLAPDLPILVFLKPGPFVMRIFLTLLLVGAAGAQQITEVPLSTPDIQGYDGQHFWSRFVRKYS